MTVIRANLIGSNQATAAGVTVSGRNAPALALCRALVEAGHDPATPLEAYRGTTLCLRVRSIGEGARLTVRESTDDGRPRFVTYRPGPDAQESVGGRPPMRQMAEGYAYEEQATPMNVVDAFGQLQRDVRGRLRERSSA
jgi:hypothetical protein